ncbi:MAG: outer membrane protein [Candidatus Nucleicultricaceae bacterium]
MNKRVYGLGIALASCMLLGEVSATETFGGFSAGLGGGYSLANPAMERTLIATGVKDSNTPSVHGFLGGLTLGYGHHFQNSFFLGGEVSALFGSGNGKTETFVNLGQPISSRLNQKHRFGAALQVGYVVNNTVLPYVKIGAAFSQWDSNTDALPLLGAASFSKYKPGLDLGVGVQLLLTKNLSLGFEYSHAEYQEVNYTVNNNIGAQRINVSIKPRDNLIILKLRFIKTFF